MVGKVDARLKDGQEEIDKRASKALQNEKENAITACSLKGCHSLITVKISSSEMEIGEDISAGYRVLGMVERSASGRGRKTCIFRTSAFPHRVIACPEGVTR
jgi:hypothetical protein